MELHHHPISKKDVTPYAGWRERRRSQQERAAQLDARLSLFRRLRLRPPAEAAFLRRIGTPEQLIGPVGTDEEVARQRRELVDFARRLRNSR